MTQNEALLNALSAHDRDAAISALLSGAQHPAIKHRADRDMVHDGVELLFSSDQAISTLGAAWLSTLPVQVVGAHLLSSIAGRAIVQQTTHGTELYSHVSTEMARRIEEGLSEGSIKPRFFIPHRTNGGYRPIIITGSPGTGKTSFAEALRPGAELIRIPCGAVEPTDLVEYNVPIVQADGTAELLRLLSTPEIELLSAANIGSAEATLIFDDVTAAPPGVQSTLLETAQFGTFGGIKLGENVQVVFTGNGTEDLAMATDWSRALIGRCTMVHWKPEIRSWANLKSNINAPAELMAFLLDTAESTPNFFAPHPGDPQTTDSLGRYPSPRAWSEFLHDFTTTFYEPDRNWRNAMERFNAANKSHLSLFKSFEGYLASFVGDKAARGASLYTRMFSTYPRVEELLDNPKLWDALPLNDRINPSGKMGIGYGILAHIRRNGINWTDKPKAYVEKIIKPAIEVMAKLDEGNEYKMILIGNCLKMAQSGDLPAPIAKALDKTVLDYMEENDEMADSRLITYMQKMKSVQESFGMKA